MQTSTATVSWTDLNRDDIADGGSGCVYLSPGCEINFAQVPARLASAVTGTLMPTSTGRTRWCTTSG